MVSILVNWSNLFSDELNNQRALGVDVSRTSLEALLDGLDLLRHGREHSLLQSVELVEAAPSADLTSIP
jgi:hypothetical protein